MSTQFFLEETDIDTLINLLLRSQQSRSREALCFSIGINPKRISFIRDSSDSDFFLLLIRHLNEIGEQEALCKLCCKELIPIFHHGQYATILSDIAVKLNCDQNLSQGSPNNKQPTVLSSIPTSRVSVNPFIQLAKNKLIQGGVILLVVLAGYPTYQYFKQPHQSPTPQEPRATLPVSSPSSTPLVNFAATVFEANNKTCPPGSTLVTYQEALDHRDELIPILGQYDIARLANGGSMDGWGYQSKIREVDKRQLGNALCKKLQ